MGEHCGRTVSREVLVWSLDFLSLVTSRSEFMSTEGSSLLMGGRLV